MIMTEFQTSQTTAPQGIWVGTQPRPPTTTPTDARTPVRTRTTTTIRSQISMTHVGRGTSDGRQTTPQTGTPMVARTPVRTRTTTTMASMTMSMTAISYQVRPHRIGGGASTAMGTAGATPTRAGAGSMGQTTTPWTQASGRILTAMVTGITRTEPTRTPAQRSMGPRLWTGLDASMRMETVSATNSTTSPRTR